MKSSGVSDLREVYIVKDILNTQNAKKLFSQEELKLLDKCDLILIYNDFNRIIDDHILLALNVEYIDKETNIEKQLKNSLENIRSLVKFYNLGFDSICVWHHFNKKVEEEVIRKFCSTINNTISKVDLPIIHLATKIMIGNTFKMFSPDEIDARSEVSQLIRILLNIIRDEKRLPPQKVDEKFLSSREKMKKLLGK